MPSSTDQTLHVSPIPAFNDNYIWMVDNRKDAIVVDPGDAAPVLSILQKRSLKLCAIVLTHRHEDHIGGVARLLEEYEKDHKKEITDENILEKISEANKQRVHIAKSKSGIVVKGINDMAVRFSKCCNPVPGDEIVGFVTRGRGMSIHRTDCINIINLSDVERSRLITAEWEDNDLEEGGQYLAELKIFADDRRGLLLDVSKVFTEEKIDVKSMNTRTSKKGTATMEMGFVVHGREELNRVIGKLRQIENVIDIERTTG